MKIITTLSLAAITAVLIGCGSGSSGDNVTPEILNTSSTSSNSSSSVESMQSINAHNIAGYTVMSQKPVSFTAGDIQSASYVFMANNKAGIVYTYLDGSTRVMIGSYSINTLAGVFTLQIDGNWIDDGGAISDSITLNADQNIDEASIAGLYPIMKIILNSENGIDESVFVVQSSSSSISSNSSSSSSSIISSSSSISSVANGNSLTVKNVDDVKGYKFTSVQAVISGISVINTIEIDCNENFTYVETLSYQGNEATVVINDNRISIFETISWGTRFEWRGTDSDGDPVNNFIYINDNDKIVVNESCFVDHDCANGIYVESIEKIATCN